MFSRPSISSEADLKPHLEAPEVGVKLNDANNLEWTILVSPNEEKDLVVKWTVEVPANETVEFREDFCDLTPHQTLLSVEPTKR
ncbi:Conserved hypothetical protein CHP02231 [Aphelenchoides avenae]|nr:Conserved hypothetical protein CHP02231 [Aphelenchus avenae]